MKLIYTFLKRLIVFVILAGIMGTVLFAGVGWYLWQNSHNWMTNITQQALKDKFPGWPVQITSSVLDGDGRVRINDIIIRSPIYGDEIVRIPEMQLEIDRQLFIEKQKINLLQVKIRNPVLLVIKREDQSWNFTELPPLPQKENNKLPGVQIENGTIACQLTSANAPKKVFLNCEQITTSLKFNEEKILAASGNCVLGPVGQLDYEVQFSLPTKEYYVKGKLPRVVAGNELINLLLSLKPEYEESLAKIETKKYLSKTLAQNGELPLTPGENAAQDHVIRNVSQSTSSGEQADAESTEGDYGTELNVTAEFELASHGKPDKPDWIANATIEEGRIIHPALPFPLYYISGGIKANNEGVKVDTFHASYGQTELNVSGNVNFPLKPMIDGIDISMKNLMINDRLRTVLPTDLKKVYDELNVNGPSDLKVKIFPKSEKKFDWFLTSMTLKDCQAKLEKFPYPLTHVNGVVWQDSSKVSPTLLLFKLDGMAGQQQITANGGVVNPGPGYESIIDIGVKNVPIDDTLRKAMPSQIRKTLEEMKLRGRADVVARLVRPPVNGKPFQIMLNCELREGAMNWSLFPYDVKQLTGNMVFANDFWKFSNIEGVHDTTKIRAAGFYAPKDPSESINFRIQAEEGYFNQALEYAISACGKSLQSVWQELNPAGSFNMDVTLKKKPDAPMEVIFNSLETKSADLLLKNFPYRLSNIKTMITGSMENLSIDRFQANNGQTMIAGKGKFDIRDSRWRLKVYDFHVDDLLPDHSFRAAVAKPLRDAIEGIALKDRLSLSGEFTMNGSCVNSQEPVHTTWDLETILTGIQLMAGLEFKNIHGKIDSKGSYNSVVGLVAVGNLHLDSMETEGYQVLKIKGPYEIQGEEIILGSRRMFGSNTKELLDSPPKPEERITGKLFDGIITVDAISILNKQNPYRVRLTLTEGKLEKWAQTSGYSSSDIKGNMNGWVDIQGDVNWKQTQVGRGRLWISPAEIYQLPLLIRIFRALQFVPPDKTAFRYAFADFYVNGNQFLFDHIDLIGEAISLVGNGYISFDRRVALDFDSLVPRSQIPIPILNNLINSRFIRGTSKGVISVTVRGNLNDPDIQVNAGVPIVEEAMKNFMKTVERGTNEVMPLLVQPPQFAAPNNGVNNVKPGNK